MNTYLQIRYSSNIKYNENFKVLNSHLLDPQVPIYNSLFLFTDKGKLNKKKTEEELDKFLLLVSDKSWWKTRELVKPSNISVKSIIIYNIRLYLQFLLRKGNPFYLFPNNPFTILDYIWDGKYNTKVKNNEKIYEIDILLDLYPKSPLFTPQSILKNQTCKTRKRNINTIYNNIMKIPNSFPKREIINIKGGKKRKTKKKIYKKK